MKAAFLLILLLTPALAFSQYYPDSNSYCNLVPYYDYTLCAKGIKDEHDSILLEPRYSEIQLLPNDVILVCENEKYGVIDCNFKTIIPVEYKQLRWTPKYAYQARCEKDYCWSIETNEGKGLLNNKLEVIISPKYDQVERVILEEQNGPHNYTTSRYNYGLGTPICYKVTSNGKSIILNEQGKEIISSTFQNVKCIHIDKPSSTEKLPNGTFFFAEDDSSRMILSEQGEQLFKVPKDRQLTVFSIDSSTLVITKLRDNISKVTCLETGESTEWSKSYISKDEFLMFESFMDGSFKVYGPKLRVIYTGENWNHDKEVLLIKERLFLRVTTRDKLTTLFSRNGEVLLQTEDQLFTTGNQNRGCIWTVPWEFKEEDTIRIYFPNGLFKKEHVVTTVQSSKAFKNANWRSYFDESHPLLFIKQGSKWGALNRVGDLAVPFRYDDFVVPVKSAEGTNRRPEKGKIIAYYVQKNGKMGALDINGDELYPCKYDTLFNAHVEFTDYTFYASHGYPEHFDFNEKYFCHFAIRKNKLVSFIERKERVCDSTFLLFEGELMLIGNVLIDVDGTVIRKIDTGTIHKAKKFLLHIQGDIAQVILLSGKLGLKIENFKSAQVEDNYLKIKLTDETMGVISLDGKRWLYKPKYYDISFTKFPPDHAWVKEDTLQTITEYSVKRLETYDGRWILVDTLYNQLLDFPFRFPVNLIHYPQAIFESNTKIGMIDSSLNVIFPPEYRFIYSLQYSEYSLLRDDSLWRLGHSSGAVLNQGFESITYQEVNGTIAVFSYSKNDTLIGFVKYDDGFKWVVPMKEMHALIETGSLQKALKSNARYINAGLQNPIDSLERWRIKNNEIVISYALYQQCNLRLFNMGGLNFIADFEYNQQKYHDPGKQFFEEVNTRTFSGPFVESKFTYPEELKDYRNIASYAKCLTPRFHTDEMLSVLETPNCSSHYYSGDFKNYVYFDSIQEVELSDILFKNEETSAFLRELIMKWYTEQQSDAEVCPDLVKIEERMWADFSFCEGGISFPSLTIGLKYDQLKPHLTNFGKRLSPW